MNRKNFLMLVLIFLIIFSFWMVKNNKLIKASNEHEVLVSKINAINNETFLNKCDELNKSVENYEIAKNEIDKEKIDFSDNLEFSIEELWISIGSYATSEDVEIDLNFEKDEFDETYKINFKVVGDYNKIVKFCDDIEKDSKLNFEIKDFKIEKNESNFDSNFYVENVKIKE